MSVSVSVFVSLSLSLFLSRSCDIGVAKAVDAMDGLTLLTGKFLRSYPLLRLAFVIYLLVLHMWVLLVLVVKMETIEIESPGVGQLPPNLRQVGPGS